MLKITIDATPVQPNASGVGLYVTNLIRSLHTLQVKENFQLSIAYQPGLKNWLRRNICPPESLNIDSQVRIVPIPVRISDILLSIPSEGMVSKYFEKYLDEPDILQGTNYCVYPCRNTLKVMNIYDLTFIKFPNYTNSVVKKYNGRVKKCLQWTDLVLTISESSKKDIVEYLDVDPQRIYVTPLASRYHYGYLSEELAHQMEASSGYDFSKPYLLFVSTIEPRKNINSLISAFNLLKQKYKIKHQLVLIGQKGWDYEPIFAEIESSAFRSEIHHLDYLSDEMVALFYSKADAFVYPSHYEGFGLPVLEAMTLGAPVITSNTSSLPEVAGDAALFIEPDDPTSLVDAILKVIGDSQLRSELIQKGKERAKLFSWERTAQETLKAYKSLLT